MDDLSRKLRLGIETEHVYRGVERSNDGALAALDFGVGGFSGGVALHQPFESDEPREFNLGAAYAWRCTDALALELSARQFWFDDVVGASVDRSLEVGAALAWTTPGGFTPRIGVYRDLELEADTVHASVGHEIALTRWGAFLELSAFAGWSQAKNLRFAGSGASARDGYGYFGGKARVPYRIGEVTVVSLGVVYTGTHGQSRVWSPAAEGGGDRLAVRLQFEWEI